MFLEPKRLPILSNSYSDQAKFSKMKTISQFIYTMKNPPKEGNIDNDATTNLLWDIWKYSVCTWWLALLLVDICWKCFLFVGKRFQWSIGIEGVILDIFSCRKWIVIWGNCVSKKFTLKKAKLVTEWSLWASLFVFFKKNLVTEYTFRCHRLLKFLVWFRRHVSRLAFLLS